MDPEQRQRSAVRCRRVLLCFFSVATLVITVGSLLIPAARVQAGSALRSVPLQVTVAENFWGSIASQEGGSRVHVTSIIVNPNTDPHVYEPKVSDARLFADSKYVILNGAGYDPWGPKLLAANPIKGRRTLIVADLVGKKEGDNPHMWYSPTYVTRVAAQISADYKRLEPYNAAYFDRQHARFMNVALKSYRGEIGLIGRKYHGVPVGATESIFVYLANALQLDLTTPPGFMKALSEGTTPTAQDKAKFDDQVTHKEIKVFVFNSQNSTPDTAALLRKARASRIPTVSMTETLAPPSATFQQWQLSQLQALARALAKATGR